MCSSVCCSCSDTGDPLEGGTTECMTDFTHRISVSFVKKMRKYLSEEIYKFIDGTERLEKHEKEPGETTLAAFKSLRYLHAV